MTRYLDPHNAAFVAAITGMPPAHILGYVQAREAIEILQEHSPAQDILTKTVEVPTGEETTTAVIFRPKDAPKMCPMVFYTHGGGWILGSPKSFAALMEDLARQSGAAMVFPYYTPAPEKQYPFQFEQTYAVLDYFACNGEKHGLQTDSIALAGDSVGGHMAIAMMAMSIERRLSAKVGHVVLFYPVTDTHMKMDSYETFKNDAFLSSDTMDWMIDAFLPNKKDRENALTSPLTFMPDEMLAKFSLTTIILSDHDVLLDEGRAFGHRLQKARVETAVIRGEGQIHAFALIKPTRESATARAIVELAVSRMRKAFSPAIVQ